MKALKALLVCSALLCAPQVFANPPGHAECEAKALSKDGKPLSGAAKNASMKKCMAEHTKSGCEAKALSKDGKPLSGAAKNAFMKKCEANPA